MKAVLMFVAAAVLSLSPMLAMANCTTHTIMQGGRMVTCTTCCSGGHCTTSCF